MKRIFLLSTIISSCLFTIVFNQSTAQDLNQNMPSGGKQRCYPASKCTGDPNTISGSGNQQVPLNESGNLPRGNQAGYSYNSSAGGQIGAPSSKGLQTESTEKFSGVVKSVNRVALPNQTQIQIVLTTDQGDMLVIVGPANFVDQAKIKLQVGDKIMVTGYRVTANGNDVILAAQIQKNGSALQLLDDSRKPLWEMQNSGMPGGGGSGAQYQRSPNGMQGGSNAYYQGSPYSGLQGNPNAQYQGGIQYNPGMHH